LVNDQLAGSQETVVGTKGDSVAAWPDGRFVVAWEGDVLFELQTDVFVRFFTAEGGAENDDVRVNQWIEGRQRRPSMTTLDDERIVLVWESCPTVGISPAAGQDADDCGVFGIVLSWGSTEPIQEFQVNSYTIGDQGYPSVARISSGGFVVVWESCPTGAYDGQDGWGCGIFAQIFGSDGVPAGDEFQVNSLFEGTQTRPECASLANGFAIHWSNEDYVWETVEHRLAAFDSVGGPVGAEIQMNPLTGKSSWETAALAVDFVGGFFAVWRGGPFFDGPPGNEAATWEFFVRHFASLDLLSAPPTEVIAPCVDPSYQGGFSIAASNDGGFVVVWPGHIDAEGCGDSEDNVEKQMYVVRYGSDGAPIGAPHSASSLTKGYNNRPAVATFGDGSFVVVWTNTPPFESPEMVQDKDLNNVFFQRFNALGEKIWRSCNNGQCEMDESCDTCPADCGKCVPVIVYHLSP